MKEGVLDLGIVKSSLDRRLDQLTHRVGRSNPNFAIRDREIRKKGPLNPRIKRFSRNSAMSSCGKSRRSVPRLAASAMAVTLSAVDARVRSRPTGWKHFRAAGRHNTLTTTLSVLR